MKPHQISRRRLLGGVVATAAGALAHVGVANAQQSPSAPSNVRLVSGGAVSSRPVLSRSDFSLLGWYELSTAGWDSVFSAGLTHRYVGADLRFLLFDYTGNTPKLTEFSLGGANYRDVVGTPLTQWASAWGAAPPMYGQVYGLWWDEAQQRLWTVQATDYNADRRQVQIYTRRLNSDGSISELHGPVGLEGIPDKRVYGGVQPVPASFQAQYGVGPYAVGWGGYTSLVAQGGVASMGPTMYLIQDPKLFSSGTEMPTTAFKTAMDCSAATRGDDWYLSGGSSPRTFDRGVRLAPVTNYFDGNDPRQNPTSRPTVPPAPGNWLSPSPDGFGRWTWGDSYYGTGCWIDGPNKSGFVAIASLAGGYAWYSYSTLNFDRRSFEFHIYDPAKIGEAIQGLRPAWNVKPSSVWAESFEGLGARGLQGNNVYGNVGAATYDSTTRRLYVLGCAAGELSSRLYVYAVNA